ncbi:hypothetical protein HCG51_02595 [Tolypothrix sp. PCC 7910]|uniref:hypothetical protein n=1 Tax=Tolypothrix sp. PCC 7910 TaxID=2099387 RepID=UPI0014276EC8|nr:hypothetical protein [Tolypothrix sp. PCC 7910]QIR35748.1 hypothetical protein HCG51_02595 [Tolypothrix sp. PCC 7910]
MNKIKYPTVDLFIYNLADVSDKTEYEKYWEDLAADIQKHKLAQIPKSTSNYLTFEIPSRKIDGSYSRVSVYDTYCLNYSASFDEEIELSRLPSLLSELKNLALIPKVKNLSPGQLSENGYQGQTLMVSGWIVPDNSQIAESEAIEIYKALFPQGHQYQSQGNFLGATVYEMWRGKNEWEGIEKDSHVIIIFYPNEQAFVDAAKNYQTPWRDLFHWRHKIIWAYQQGKQLKPELAKPIQHQSDITVLSTSLAKQGLGTLKSELEANSEKLAKYIQDINLLQIQQHTVKINLENYKRHCNKHFKTADWLKEFSEVAEKKYNVQLETDFLSLNAGLAMLENVTNTIRGMVEIEQTQRDRNLSNTVAIAGVGLATSQVASSIILAQEPPPPDIPFFQTPAFWWSLTTGVVASLILWSILRLYRLIANRFRG